MVGLWKAKKRFGPDARGPLIIQKTGVDYIADLAGRKVAVVMDKAELTFVLPDNQGAFRGKFEAKGILGHWFRPGTLVNGRRPYYARRVYAFAALGAGGQNVMVVSELQLVLASFSGSYATGAYRRFSDELIPQHNLPAVREGTTK